LFFNGVSKVRGLQRLFITIYSSIKQVTINVTFCTIGRLRGPRVWASDKTWSSDDVSEAVDRCRHRRRWSRSFWRAHVTRFPESFNEELIFLKIVY